MAAGLPVRPLRMPTDEEVLAFWASSRGDLTVGALLRRRLRGETPARRTLQAPPGGPA